MKNLFNNFIKIIDILINNKILKKPEFSEKKIVLLGKINELNNYKKKKIYNLS